MITLTEPTYLRPAVYPDVPQKDTEWQNKPEKDTGNTNAYLDPKSSLYCMDLVASINL